MNRNGLSDIAVPLTPAPEEGERFASAARIQRGRSKLPLLGERAGVRGTAMSK